MAEVDIKIAKSVQMFLFDKNKEVKFHCILPLKVIAPAANRIMQEVVNKGNGDTGEFWYTMIPHCTHQSVEFNRAVLPEGITSLYGVKYIPENEPPPRVLPHPEPHVKFFTVIINNYQKEIYRGQYSVDDLFLHGAEFVAKSLVEQGRISLADMPFYYKVEVSPQYVDTIERNLLPKEAFNVKGVFHLPKQEEERTRLTFTRVATPPLEVARKSQFGTTKTMGRGKKEQGTVIIRQSVYNDLLKINMSEKIESGGYLLGNTYRAYRSPESEDDPKFRWIIEITDLITAEKTYGSAVLLLFSGDTWSRMRRRIDREYPDKKLLSWFHTHLFAASDDFGLSGLDLDLHRQFFSRSWHVAVLVNIDAQSRREVRCFQKNNEGDLVECTFEVTNE